MRLIDVLGAQLYTWQLGSLTMTVWDVLTLVIVVALVISCVVLYRTTRRRHQRYRLACHMWTVIVAMGVLLMGYGTLIEAYWPEETHTTRHLPLLPAGKTWRLGVVSDLHVGPCSSRATIRHVVERLNAAKLDAVLIPGDFVAHTDVGNVTDLHALDDLKSRLGTFAVLGNHDFVGSSAGRQQVIDVLNRSGVRMVRNTTIPFDDDWFLMGVDSLWARQGDIRSALQTCPDPTRTIAIVHEPDGFVPLAEAQFPLILAGHTHGGQIRLPLWGTLVTVEDISPQHRRSVLSRDRQSGWFQHGQSQLFVTRGVGTTGPRARLFCRPEIAIITLQGA